MNKSNIKLTLYSLIFAISAQCTFPGTDDDNTSSTSSIPTFSSFKRVKDIQNERQTPSPIARDKNSDSPNSISSIRTPTPKESDYQEELSPAFNDEKNLKNNTETMKTKNNIDPLKDVLKEQEDQVKEAELTVEQLEEELREAILMLEKEKKEAGALRAVTEDEDLKIKSKTKESDEASKALARVKAKFIKEKIKSEANFIEFEKLVLQEKSINLTPNFIAKHFMDLGISPRQSAIKFLILAAKFAPRHLETIREFPNSTTKYKALLNMVEDIEFEGSKQGKFLMDFMLEVRALANNYWSTNFSPAVFNTVEPVFDASPMTQPESNYDSIASIKRELSLYIFPARKNTEILSRKFPFIPRADARELSNQNLNQDNVRSINEN